MDMATPSWRTNSWRSRAAAQMPAYGDADALASVEARLGQASPVVSFAGCAELRARMATLAEGRGFLLQGGDCAESFDDPVAEQVAGITGLFDTMKERLAAHGPLIEVARIAGQFAKPRSAPTEEHDGKALPAYRGDIINGIAFDSDARHADPMRMIRAQ
jgi:3-deoxy-7-phosphoheptulonate synthase